MARKIDRLFDDDQAPGRREPLLDLGRLILPPAITDQPAAEPEQRLPLEKGPMDLDSPPAKDNPKLRGNKRGK